MYISGGVTKTSQAFTGEITAFVRQIHVFWEEKDTSLFGVLPTTSPNSTPVTDRSELGHAEKAGIGITAAIVFLTILGAAYYFFFRSQKRKQKPNTDQTPEHPFRQLSQWSLRHFHRLSHKTKKKSHQKPQTHDAASQTVQTGPLPELMGILPCSELPGNPKRPGRYTRMESRIPPPP
ncbi:hypothetical protein QBC34DRAFT_417554, partial [Podospora aff. communis PSN243]